MSEKILIVEDNPQNMKLIKMILRGKGYRLLEATDGREALNTAMKENPNLIIMDVQLPKMSGLEVAKKLKEKNRFKKIPIIGLTAFAMKEDREKVFKAGCDAYISKPMDTHALPRVVAGMLRKWKVPG